MIYSKQQSVKVAVMEADVESRSSERSMSNTTKERFGPRCACLTSARSCQSNIVNTVDPSKVVFIFAV